MIDINELRRLAQANYESNSVDSLYALQDAFDYKTVLDLLDRLEAWENVFGHLGTPDEVGNEWHALSDRLEAAEKERDALRAELAQIYKEADKFDDGIDWIQRAMQAEAKIEVMEERCDALLAHSAKLEQALQAMTKTYRSVPYAQWPAEMHFANEVLEKE